MTDQQQADYDLISDLWHLLREYGDLTNDGTFESVNRWTEFLDKSSALKQKYPEARKILIEIEFMLNDRAIASNQGDLKTAC